MTSLDTGNPISSVGLIVKAGTRNETAQNRGLTHALRIAACYATKNNTAFSIVRNLQQQGGDLSVTTSREYTLYSSQLPRINVNEALEYFLATAESPAFKVNMMTTFPIQNPHFSTVSCLQSWEISDNVPGQMNFDLDKVCKPTKAIELLHQAAFRDGLGNSIYSPAHMVREPFVVNYFDYILNLYVLFRSENISQPCFKSSTRSTIWPIEWCCSGWTWITMLSSDTARR